MSLRKVHRGLLDFCAPLRKATKKDRFRWGIETLIGGIAIFCLGIYVQNHYRIGWDRQVFRCLDARFYLIDLKDKRLERNGLYVFHTASAEPILTRDMPLAKYLRGLPGDTVEVRESDQAVLVNGVVVAKGLPHLSKVPIEHRKFFFGKRVLKPDEYWVMGTKPLSFDSRYWGVIHEADIEARAYELF